MSDPAGDEPASTGRRFTLTVRLSPFSYALWAVAFVVLLFIFLSLVLPWGRQPSTSEDIKAGVYGLLPWFVLVPVFLQVAFPMVQSRTLQVFYIVSVLLLSAGLLLIQYLGGISFETDLRAGFYLVYVACILSIGQGFVMTTEALLFGRLLDRGRARITNFGRIS